MKISFFAIITCLILFILYGIISQTGLIVTSFISFLKGVITAFKPLIYGLLLAYFLSPIVKFYNNRFFANFEKKGKNGKNKLAKKIYANSRVYCVLLSFITVLLALAAVISALYSMLVGKLSSSSLSNMISNMSSHFTEYDKLFAEISTKLEATGLSTNIKDPIASFFNWLSTTFIPETAANLSTSITSISGSIITIILGLVVGFYILKDLEFFSEKWRGFLRFILPVKSEEQLMHLLSEIHIIISKFFRGQILAGLIVGVLSSIGLTAIGLEYAILIGMLAGIANVIPYFGPILGMIPAVLVAILDLNFSLALLSIVVLLVVQQVDSAIISPRIVGDSVGLHPVMVLLAISIGGRYFGIIGMLIAVPTAAVLVLLSEKIKEPLIIWRNNHKEKTPSS